MKMNHYVKCVTAGIVCSLMYGNVCAQDTFDLSSQRSEKQDVQAVPGKKVDHKGLILNPQPHQIVTMAGKTCDLSQGINLKDKQNKFAGYLDFLSPNKKGVKLTIDFGAKAARKAHVKEVSGAYALAVNEKGITITGFRTRKRSSVSSEATSWLQWAV